VGYARKYVHPILEPEARRVLQAFYLELRNSYVAVCVSHTLYSAPAASTLLDIWWNLIQSICCQGIDRPTLHQSLPGRLNRWYGTPFTFLSLFIVALTSSINSESKEWRA
jgi:hypothetical protein